MVTQRRTLENVLDPEEVRQDRARPVQQDAAINLPGKASLISKLKNLSKGTKLKLKIGFSVVVFASLFIFGKVDLTKSIEVASQANLGLLALATVLLMSTMFINAWRWQLLANAVGLARPLMQLTQYCFVGLFFNMFLPSTVGGDVTRCYYLAKGTHKYKAAAYSVLADRVVGISVLFLFASLGIAFGPGAGALPWQMKAPIILGAIGVFGVIPLIPALSKRILGPDHWLTVRFTNSAARVYWRNGRLIATSLAQSTLMQIVLVICHIAIGLSLGLTQVPLWYYFVFYPLVAVLGFVTPSFNGIGVREGAYTYFLMLPVAGVDKPHAFTYALIWLSLNTLSSLLGGLVYVAGHFKFSEADAEKLQHDADDESD